jgi:hypothetical protein
MTGKEELTVPEIPEIPKEIPADGGVTYQMIKSVFRCNSSKTPVVYLYCIGKASDLLNGEYSEHEILCKFGCTNDLERRCGEHHKAFFKEFETDIRLLCFSIVEPEYIFDAETSMKLFFKDSIVDYNGSKELCIINKRELPKIRHYYGLIQNNYIGKYEETAKRIVGLEKQVMELSHSLKMKEKDNDIMRLMCENERASKDAEWMKYKLQMLTNSMTQSP